MEVPINQFFIKSDFREDIVDQEVGKMALSIKQLGLIQPIVTQMTEDGKYEIIAGRIRFRALKDYLKLSFLEHETHFIVRQELDPLLAQLEENLQRHNFKPLEVAALVKTIHTQKIAEFGLPVKGVGGGWSMQKTAHLLGRDKSFISRLLMLAENNDLVAEGDTLTDALDKVMSVKAKKIAAKVRKVRATRDVERIYSIDELLKNLKNEDVRKYLPTLPDESIDFVLTDPPFGINLDKVVTTEQYSGEYEDNPEDVYAMMQEVLPHLVRVLKQDKYILIGTSYTYLGNLRKSLIDLGITIANAPLIWVKLNSNGKSMNPELWLANTSLVMVYGWKGNAALSIPGRNNIFPYPIPTTNRFHIAQMPEALIIDWLKIFSNPGDIVLDTFSGSGAVLRGCYLTGRSFKGCEKDENNYYEIINYSREWADKEPLTEEE
jgi:DNA modification methylase